jgi:hypothetical protein
MFNKKVHLLEVYQGSPGWRLRYSNQVYATQREEQYNKHEGRNKKTSLEQGTSTTCPSRQRQHFSLQQKEANKSKIWG